MGLGPTTLTSPCSLERTRGKNRTEGMTHRGSGWQRNQMLASREGRCRRTRAERLGELRAQESLDICFDVLSCGDQGLQSGLSWSPWSWAAPAAAKISLLEFAPVNFHFQPKAGSSAAWVATEHWRHLLERMWLAGLERRWAPWVQIPCCCLPRILGFRPSQKSQGWIPAWGLQSARSEVPAGCAAVPAKLGDWWEWRATLDSAAAAGRLGAAGRAAPEPRGSLWRVAHSPKSGFWASICIMLCI